MYEVKVDKVKMATLFQEKPQPALYLHAWVQFEVH